MNARRAGFLEPAGRRVGFLALVCWAAIVVGACGPSATEGPAASVPTTDLVTGAPPAGEGFCAELDPIDFDAHAAERERRMADALASPEAAVLADELRDAYASDSVEALDAFLESWRAEVPARDAAAVSTLPEVVQEAYAIFAVVYQPKDLVTTTGAVAGTPGPYDEVPYVVVQEELPVLCADQLPAEPFLPEPAETRRQSVLADFRPPVEVPGAATLQLTPRYAAALSLFLEGDSGGTATPVDPERADRQAFLAQRLVVWPAQILGPWMLETHPELQALILTADGARARVLFRIGHEGGHIELARTGGTWTIEEVERNWIE